MKIEISYVDAIKIACILSTFNEDHPKSDLIDTGKNFSDLLINTMDQEIKEANEFYSNYKKTENDS